MSTISSVLRTTSSTLASQIRGWQGTSAFWPARNQPQQPVVLYEFEACPFCRLVREALTEFDLDAEIRPCPKGGLRFRPQVEKAGGKQQFPYLEDPNTGASLYESGDIIAYLAKTYDAPRRPITRRLRPVHVLTGEVASLMRGLRGTRARASVTPELPLELFSFESSPFSRPVREVLCELELPYILRSTGKARLEDMGPPWVRKKLFPDLPIQGRNRTRLLERAGTVQVPYLIDPNTGVEMFESQDIIAYLERTYAQ